MGKKRVELGRAGERLIDSALQQRHFTIIERNWRCPRGEVDLIAKRDGEWYFVEVRTRRGSQPVSPEQGLTFRKRDRMEMVARSYIGQHVDEADIGWHLSFAAVVVTQNNAIKRITFYPDIDGVPVELL